MAQHSIDWNLYRSLLAVIRTGSLSAAARALRLTQPTVGRHIDELEQRLDASLFVRGQRGLTPTSVALNLLPHAESMEAAAGALVRAASGEAEDVSGTVRLTASEVIGCEVLPSILSEFRHRYPGIVFELVTSNRVSNLLTREADIAIRMTRPQQGALVAKRVGRVPIRLYAHRNYVDRYGSPRTIEALQRHSLIGFDAEPWAVERLPGSDAPLTRELFDFRSDNDLAQLAALRAGLGIGGTQKAIAERDTMLVPILEGQIAFELEMWLAMHQDLRNVPRVRVMFDHLAQALAQYCGR